ncbi:MAG: hypothetical protein KME04_20940 [Pleurocapsa minor GSE-CHR-MK-17-07R]|jgi:hypothetical protein|nr:hypothetical protein [Pleurocapsa minor GSE-CHR-MK 17-07R]
MAKRHLLVFCLLLLCALNVAPAAAQTNLVDLTARAGYDGAFRPGAWTPVWVEVANNGDDLSGQIIVRPETSGDGLPNAFSTPITLAGGARQNIPLVITPQSFATQLRVELMDDAGIVRASQTVAIRGLSEADTLYLVFNDTPTGIIDLTEAAFGGTIAAQANWPVEQLPESAELLRSVDVILFDDVDTTGLNQRQKDALREWVTGGGHLIGAGGANWQATDAGLLELLPVVPDGSTTVDSLAALADTLRLPASSDAQLQSGGAIIVTTGALAADAEVLVALGADQDSLPLVARREQGAGVVDFIAADPNAEPLRSWDGLPALWLMLQSSRAPQPGWSQGYTNADQSIRAAEILPGVDALPDVLPLIGFLALYIAIIGPANFLALKRLNRLEWAWVTIPVSIIVFTAAAWLLGYSLRGDDAILNRLTVVQAWSEGERARADGIIGVFSPRRTSYSMQTGEDNFLRPIPAIENAGSLLTSSAAAATNIVQTNTTTAENFSVDASFVSPFWVSGMVERPAVTGAASLQYDATIPGQMVMRGSVANETSVTLRDPVILARGMGMMLAEPIAAGEVAVFEGVLPGQGAASDMPLIPTRTNSFLTFRQSTLNAASEQSVAQIIGPERYELEPTLFLRSQSPEDEDLWRRQLMLWSIVDDSYESSGRGDEVYLAAWADLPQGDLSLAGADWSEQVTTLVLIQLETEVARPQNEDITIAPDRFTWAALEYQGVGGLTPVDLNMSPGEIVSFRYTPLPTARLREVDSLSVTLANLNTGSRRVPISLYNYDTASWDEIIITRDGFTTNNPGPYLGPHNAIEMRLVADEIGGYLRIGRIDVTQTGQF